MTTHGHLRGYSKGHDTVAAPERVLAEEVQGKQTARLAS